MLVLRNPRGALRFVAAALMASMVAGCGVGGDPIDLGGGERPLGKPRQQGPVSVTRAPYREPGASNSLLRASR